MRFTVIEPVTYSGLAIGLIVTLVLIFYPKSQNPNNRFLGYSLLWMWHVLFINLLNSTETMLSFPHLFRTGLVSAYLIMPFLYVFTRNTFAPGISWHKRDWLLLGPAVFYLIDFLPLLLKSSAFKIQVIIENINKPQMFQTAEGWLTPAGFHYGFIYLWGLLLFILQVMLLLQNRKMEKNGIAKQNRALFSFLVIITMLYIPSIVPGIFGAVFHLNWYTLEFISLSLSASLISTAIYLLFSPQILYGFYPSLLLTTELKENKSEMFSAAEVMNSSASGSEERIVSHETNAAPDGSEKQPPRYLDEEAEQNLWQSVIALFDESQTFLNSSYSIHDLSKEVGIPVYQLSPLINRRSGSNFNQWINRYRIAFFLQLVSRNEYKHLTQEALAQKSGFNSRVTLNNAFKKEKGLSPSAYLAAVEQPKTNESGKD